MDFVLMFRCISIAVILGCNFQKRAFPNYLTMEIQFSAASAHQLAMFQNFKEIGPKWASPYRSGTAVTERIISEMQGETNEI